MINIEIDGKQVVTEPGSSVLDAAWKAGIHIPHFCYHKKLSIAASCRMCLVEVVKAPKPLPACATPVTEGMKVLTHSEMAIKAQKGVMEFLLINHPLDCPICDQGGECMLQDIAVGYGGSDSRYQEEKRIVMHKDVGELISTMEMSRCIQCTRCVRFGQEIAGMMELGMANRGEKAEIMSFVNSSVDSELSGNMIDLCPVGALTSKPFRYTARSWELSRYKSVSPHDGMGSNLSIHVKNNKVMRVTPSRNEAVNECWLSDKERFSYQGLNSPERLTKPMLKQDGKWLEVEWPVALEYVANGLRDITQNGGAAQLGALATPHSTLEELYLLQKLMKGIGSENVDFRLRQADFSADGKRAGAPWLGMQIDDINNLDRLLIVGSFLRKDHPLLAHRVRQAVKKGAQLNILHSVDDDLLCPVANKQVVKPDELLDQLLQILQALKVASGTTSAHSEISGAATSIAQSLAGGQRVAILLGNFAQQHPLAAQIAVVAENIASLSKASFGYLGEAANSVGGYIAKAIPGNNGLNASQMLVAPRKAYLLLNVEPELDLQDPQQAIAAVSSAAMVVALSAYKHQAQAYADVQLPISAFTETSGSFINTEGRVQSFKGSVKPLGDARPAWKVLRLLGNLMNVPGFTYDSSEAVRDELLSGTPLAERLNNHLDLPLPTQAVKAAATGLQRVAEVPIYTADALVRRSTALQKTSDAATPVVSMHGSELVKLGVASGNTVNVVQNGVAVPLKIVADDKLPAGVARVPAGHPATALLGAMFGNITVERS